MSCHAVARWPFVLVEFKVWLLVFSFSFVFFFFSILCIVYSQYLHYGLLSLFTSRFTLTIYTMVYFLVILIIIIILFSVTFSVYKLLQVYQHCNLSSSLQQKVYEVEAKTLHLILSRACFLSLWAFQLKGKTCDSLLPCVCCVDNFDLCPWNRSRQRTMSSRKSQWWHAPWRWPLDVLKTKAYPRLTPVIKWTPLLVSQEGTAVFVVYTFVSVSCWFFLFFERITSVVTCTCQMKTHTLLIPVGVLLFVRLVQQMWISITLF